MAKKNWVLMSIAATCVYGLILLLSLLINDDIDKNIIAILNPNEYIPVIDELMIGITDLSLASFSIVYVLWFFGYFSLIKNPNSAQPLQKFYKTIAILILIIGTSVYFWGIYDYNIIFLFWGPGIALSILLAGRSLTTMDDSSKQKMAYAMIIMVIAVIFTNAIGEVIIKNIVARPRPFNLDYAPWNEILRIFPDESTLHDYSYYSGHASGLFSLMTPLIWITPKRKTKVIFFIWASVHAFTRIYLAVHWPYDVFIGALTGFLIGTIATKIFYNPNFNLTEQINQMIHNYKISHPHKEKSQ